MRSLLLLPALALAACSSPCEKVNAAQDDPAMQTCVFSASLQEDGTGSFSAEDGAPVPFVFTERASSPRAFQDGSEMFNGVWVAPGGERPPAPEALADSSRTVYTTAAAPDAYALSMMWTGTVRIHSTDGSRQSVVRVAEGEDPTVANMGLGWPNRATHVAFAQDGAVLIGSDTQRHVTAWDAETGAERWSATVPEDGSTTGIVHLAVSPDGSRVAVATSRAVHVYDVASGEAVASWAFPGSKTYVAQTEWAPGGQHLAVAKSGRRFAAQTTYGRDPSLPNNSRPTMQRTEATQNPPTVFLLSLPG